MDSDSRAGLSSNFSGVAESFVYQIILDVKCVDATVVEDECELDPWNIARNAAA